jgi:hypothetical protein
VWGTPFENIHALVQAGRRYGSYPLKLDGLAGSSRLTPPARQAR